MIWFDFYKWIYDTNTKLPSRWAPTCQIRIVGSKSTSSGCQQRGERAKNTGAICKCAYMQISVHTWSKYSSLRQRMLNCFQEDSTVQYMIKMATMLWCFNIIDVDTDDEDKVQGRGQQCIENSLSARELQCCTQIYSTALRYSASECIKCPSLTLPDARWRGPALL